MLAYAFPSSGSTQETFAANPTKHADILGGDVAALLSCVRLAMNNLTRVMLAGG